MEIKIIDSYNLFFHPNYVIIEAHEDAVVDAKLIEKVVKLVLNYFNGKSFTIISHRKNNYSLKSDAYSPRILSKVPRFAVVSKNPGVKEKAMEEQMKFRNSFAYFENLDDAESWAMSHSESSQL